MWPQLIRKITVKKNLILISEASIIKKKSFHSISHPFISHLYLLLYVFNIILKNSLKFTSHVEQEKAKKKCSLKKIAVAVAGAAFYLITRMNYGGLLKSWFASTYKIGFCGLKEAQKIYKFYVQIHNYNFQFFFLFCFFLLYYFLWLFHHCHCWLVWERVCSSLLSKLNLNAIFYGLWKKN